MTEYCKNMHNYTSLKTSECLRVRCFSTYSVLKLTSGHEAEAEKQSISSLCFQLQGDTMSAHHQEERVEMFSGSSASVLHTWIQGRGQDSAEVIW